MVDRSEVESFTQSPNVEIKKIKIVMTIELIFTIIGFIITIVGVYYKQENRISLLELNLNNRDTLLNKIEKTLEKLNDNQETLNQTLIELKSDFKHLTR